MGKAKGAAKRRRTAGPDGRELIEDAAQFWQRQTGVERRAKAFANVLEALRWISVETSADGGDPRALEALAALEKRAIGYLDRIGETNALRSVPYPKRASADFARIAETTWNAFKRGGADEAAQFFLLKAREFGADLPELTGDHERDVRALVEALAKCKPTLDSYSTNEKRKFALARCFLKASGRGDDGAAILKNVEYGPEKKDRAKVQR